MSHAPSRRSALRLLGGSIAVAAAATTTGPLAPAPAVAEDRSGPGAGPRVECPCHERPRTRREVSKRHLSGRTAPIFDRATRTWRTVTWPGLPASEQQRVEIGPDGRAYVAVQDRTGGVPKGGWPTGSDGEADDANAKGDVYHLWSASLTDPGEGARQAQAGDGPLWIVEAEPLEESA